MLKKLKNSKNPHVKHFLDGAVALRHDLTIGQKSPFKRACIRTLSTYLPRLFLSDIPKINDSANISELREVGIQYLESLGNHEISELLRFFFDKQTKHYSTPINNANELKEFMQQNQIQRSNIVALDSQSPIKNILTKDNIKNISKSYLRTDLKRLSFTSYIFALGEVEHKNEESRNALMFHRDVDHFRFLKFFYFLSDTGVGQGHHEYLNRTHKIRRFSVAPNGRYNLEQIKKAYPESELCKISGKTGEGFVEDTSGFHRGTPVKDGFRILLMTEILPSDKKGNNTFSYPI